MRSQSLSAAMLACIVLVGVACSKSKSNEVPANSTPAASTTPVKAEIAARKPSDWLIVNETDYIPVVDDITTRMLAARKAFIAKDWKTSASDVRGVADLLNKEAAGASVKGKEQLSTEEKSLRHLAGPLENGKITSLKVFDAAIASAHRADLDRDWLAVNTTTWYPFVDEPNVHFLAAHDAFLKKDYKLVAEEIRKGEAFVRTEDGIAASGAKHALSSSKQELDQLSKKVGNGSVKTVKELDDAFAHADKALALSHQLKASESWARKDAERTGYELKAGARNLEQAVAWAGSEVAAAASASVADARSVGAKLLDGTAYTAEEVRKGIDSLGKSLGL